MTDYMRNWHRVGEPTDPQKLYALINKCSAAVQESIKAYREDVDDRGQPVQTSVLNDLVRLGYALCMKRAGYTPS